MKIDKTILKSAIDKWGHKAQFDMVQEECIELAMAIAKVKRGNSDERQKDLIDEVADMNIMIAQANMMLNPDLIQERINFKLNRLKGRIEKGEF